MKPLNELLASARRAQRDGRVAPPAAGRRGLADDVLRELRRSGPGHGPASDWLSTGRWAAGAACALALVAAVAGPDPTPPPAPPAPPSNPLADLAGW